jgi:3-dehydroshikimate dehydratase
VIRPGLCSVTFRQLPPEDVAQLAADHGLQGVEWGGDVHVPPGDLGRAKETAARCADLGVACPSYGSYLQAGRSTGGDVDTALDTAVALGARNVRVWCPWGLRPGADATEVVAGLRSICSAAAARDLTVSLEFHPNTLTETAESAVSLLEALDADSLRTYWQPVAGTSVETALEQIDLLRPWLSSLHVFSWAADGTRLPLAGGDELWRAVLGSVDGGDRFAFLEFVRDDDPAQMAEDAATLRSWL